MAGRMRTSQTGIDLITQFEGFRERSEALPDGGHVIGFGHTRHAKENQKITHEDALTLLKGHDLPPIEKAIIARSLAPLGQNEFDALVAFAFNIGLGNFLDSDVFALVNSGAKLNAAEAMAAWRKARVDGRVIVVDALVRRRAAERALFLEVPGGPTPAATPVVRPILDLATAILHPRDPSEGLVPSEDLPELDEAPEPPEQTAETEPDVATTEPDPEPVTPRAATRRVTERLTRILGEDTPVTPISAAPDEESVEEITRAVSALADPLDEETEGDDVADADGVQAQGQAQGRSSIEPSPTQEDDPVAAAAISALASKLEDDGGELLEIREDEDTVLEPIATNGSGGEHVELEELPSQFDAQTGDVVDDLEPLDLEDIDPIEAKTGGAQAPWGSLILYGLSAFGGALIGAWGVRNLREAMASTVPLESDWALYAGPFAMLIGGLIFLIMGYYLLRAIFSEG
ncbi:MAG: glycoside hydrolase family protein [Pseudomonadota bacterium]